MQRVKEDTIHFDITIYNHRTLKLLKKELKLKTLNQTLERIFGHYELLKVLANNYPEITSIIEMASKKRREQIKSEYSQIKNGVKLKF